MWNLFPLLFVVSVNTVLQRMIKLWGHCLPYVPLLGPLTNTCSCDAELKFLSGVPHPSNSYESLPLLSFVPLPVDLFSPTSTKSLPVSGMCAAFLLASPFAIITGCYLMMGGGGLSGILICLGTRPLSSKVLESRRVQNCEGEHRFHNPSQFTPPVPEDSKGGWDLLYLSILALLSLLQMRRGAILKEHYEAHCHFFPRDLEKKNSPQLYKVGEICRGLNMLIKLSWDIRQVVECRVLQVSSRFTHYSKLQNWFLPTDRGEYL